MATWLVWLHGRGATWVNSAAARRHCSGRSRGSGQGALSRGRALYQDGEGEVWRERLRRRRTAAGGWRCGKLAMLGVILLRVCSCVRRWVCSEKWTVRLFCSKCSAAQCSAARCSHAATWSSRHPSATAGSSASWFVGQSGSARSWSRTAAPTAEPLLLSLPAICCTQVLSRSRLITIHSLDYAIVKVQTQSRGPHTPSTVISKRSPSGCSL